MSDVVVSNCSPVNPYCGLHCQGTRIDYEDICRITDKPCIAPYDLIINSENCTIKLRTYMAGPAQLKKIGKMIPYEKKTRKKSAK